MSRWGLMGKASITLSVSLLLLGLGLGFPAGAGSRTAPRAQGATTRFQVAQVEYRLLLSRTVVKAGRVDLEEIDRGREQHDLRLRPASGRDGGEIRGRLLRPGTRWQGVVYLQPGTYKLWCSLPEHARRGMHALLQVVR